MRFSAYLVSLDAGRARVHVLIGALGQAAT